MAVTDVKGNIVETYNYTPYGELIDGEYREDIPLLYNGQYGVITDSNGLYYMRARYYNVEIKRFINQDVLLGVLERVSSLNRYAYVEGNPISYLDPFGLETFDTTVLHNIMTVLTGAVAILSFLPVPGVNIASIVVGSADLILNGYEVYCALKKGDRQTASAYALAMGGDIVSIVSSAIGIRIDKFFDKVISFNWGGAEGIIHSTYAAKTSMDVYGKTFAKTTLAGIVGSVIIDLFTSIF